MKRMALAAILTIAAVAPARPGWSESDASKLLEITGSVMLAHQGERHGNRAETKPAAEVGGPVGALEASGFGQAMRESPWLYPAVEIVHILGIGLLFGSIAVLDLRLLGFSRSISVKRLTRHVLPWSAAAFLLIVPSGLMMFIAHASDLIASPVFAIKMCLIMGAGLNAALFHTIVFPSVDVWDSEDMRKLGPPPSARISAAASLAVWISVIACGRLLAYY